MLVAGFSMRLEVTHRKIATLEVDRLVEIVTGELALLYAEPDSREWREVQRRSAYIGREDRPPDVAFRKLRPTGYMQLGVVNLESPAAPWALPLPAGLPCERELRAELDRIADVCKVFYGPGLLHLLVLAILAPGGRVPRHVDMAHNRAWKEFSSHLHVPLTAASACEFDIDGELFTLDKGGVYEIDNMRPHSTHNRSSEYRVNVMIDYCRESDLPRRAAALVRG